MTSEVKILVTGGTNDIGSITSTVLIKQGYEVVIDRNHYNHCDLVTIWYATVIVLKKRI